LTTTKTGTYHSSYCDFVMTDDDIFGQTVIIEIERISLIALDSIEEKYNNGHLEYKGKLEDKTLETVYSKIVESVRIETIYKELLGLI